MILDKIENAGLYQLSTGLQLGIDFFKSNNLKMLEAGQYEIGNGAFAMVSEYSTKAFEEAKPEAHKKYIDIQVLAKGEEYIGYAPLNNQKVTEDRLEENDVIFFEAETSLCKLSTGMFAIYFPTDIHQPGIQISESKKVKKIVVKVPV